MKEIKYTNFIVCTEYDENEEITKSNFFKKDLYISDIYNKKLVDTIKRQEVTFSNVIDLLSGDEKRAKTAIKHIINGRLFRIKELTSVL